VTKTKSINLVLASSSPNREVLLKRLCLPFKVRHPCVDETPHTHECTEDTVKRLSEEKALAVQAKSSEIVIGSDQLGEFKGLQIGKPLTREKNITQLLSFSGKSVRFYTGLFVIRLGDSEIRRGIVTSTIKFRTLTRTEVVSYVDTEMALDSAGGFKMEGLGISLIENFSSADPTAIIGLPLILTSRFLRELST
jgi:septum formation protein